MRALADLQAGEHPHRAQPLAEHPELVPQLEQALAGHEFIHQSTRDAEPASAQLGDFRIRRQVGRGGMGVVYEAEQISRKRRVALKVLRYGARAPSARTGHALDAPASRCGRDSGRPPRSP